MADSWTPFQRDPQTGVRYWATPGTPGFMHRIGGLEKSNETGAISTEPENHFLMTKLRAEKVEKIADSLPPLTVEGNPDADLLIVGFGGTYGHLHSAMDQLNAMGKKTALAHFRVINPLPKNTAGTFPCHQPAAEKYSRSITKIQDHRGGRAKYGTAGRLSPHESGRYSPASVQSGKRPAVRSERAGRGFQSTFLMIHQ